MTFLGQKVVINPDLKSRLAVMPKWKLLGEKQSGDFLNYKFKFEYTGKTYSVWYNLAQNPPEGFVVYPEGDLFCFLVSFVPWILFSLMLLTEDLGINTIFKTPGFIITFAVACIFSIIWSDVFWKVKIFHRTEKIFNRCSKVWFVSLVPPNALILISGNIIVIGALIGVVSLIIVSVLMIIPEEFKRYLNNLNELLTGSS